MIKIVKHKNIDNLKDKWKTLYKSCTNIVPMASFDFVKIFTSDLASKLKKILKKDSVPVYFEVLEGNFTKLILPAICNGDNIESLYTLDYYDCIYDNNSTGEQVVKYLESISRYENKALIIKRLKDDGATYSKLKSLLEFEKHNECVKILFTDNYDEYYSSLSKSARQNLRTAYNRAKTDNLNFDYEIHFGKSNKKVQKQLNKIYLNRRSSRYNNMSGLKKMLFNLSDKIADVCFGLQDSFYACLTLNKKPVAFMAGIVNGQELIVPRLAINDKYSRYSLGIVLVNETIKAIQQKGYTCLDLSTGTEQYKYQMGGTPHFTYEMKIDINNN